MKKKKRTIRERSRRLAAYHGDEILKDMNPAEPASPMMGLAKQLEQDMFASQRVSSGDTQEAPQKDADPKQPGKAEESKISGAHEFLMFVGAMALVGAAAIGLYQGISWLNSTATKQGQCYTQSDREDQVVARVDQIISGTVFYSFADMDDNTSSIRYREDRNFQIVYDKMVDCSKFYRAKENVAVNREVSFYKKYNEMLQGQVEKLLKERDANNLRKR